MLLYTAIKHDIITTIFIFSQNSDMTKYRAILPFRTNFRTFTPIISQYHRFLHILYNSLKVNGFPVYFGVPLNMEVLRIRSETYE